MVIVAPEVTLSCAFTNKAVSTPAMSKENFFINKQFIGHSTFFKRLVIRGIGISKVHQK
jgi:hypothetical protein